MTQPTVSDRSRRLAARLFGIFFILAFASYGTGSSMVASLTNSADGLAGIHAARNMFIVGIILVAVVHSLVNIGLLVALLPILKPHNPFLAYGYLAVGLTATVTLIIGAIFLALLVPLAQAYVGAGPDAATFDMLALLLKRGGFYGYQIGMTLWAVGGLLLVWLLGRSRLVPRWLPVWGLAGYVVFMIGTIAELFGYPIGVMLSLTGGLFELTLSGWLIVKGFGPANPTPTPSHFNLERS